MDHGIEVVGSDDDVVEMSMPFVFLNGRPSTLPQMTADQLVKFLEYILQYTAVDFHSKPTWWPNDLAFLKLNRLTKEQLMQIIFGCYKHNNSSFLLSYSVTLANYPSENLRFERFNAESTGIYNTVTNSLIIIIENHNLVSLANTILEMYVITNKYIFS